MATSSLSQRGAEREERRRFAEAAWRQRACAATFDARDWVATGKNWEAHHVVEKRWLRGHRLPLWNERNALRLRPDVHRKHTNRSEIIELRLLTDDNIAYAFEIMGPAAEEYLERIYRGPDDRVQRASKVAVKQMEDEIAALPSGTLWLPPHMRND